MNWLFTDMDAFFASVEQSLRPELRGRPVGVIPTETESTCVIAASYDAKLHGVKTGTLVREARRLCPGIALVKARPDLYVDTHHKILESVDECAPVEKVYSIDEWSVRLRGGYKKPTEAEELGRTIKRKLLADFGPVLTCSIGIAPSRLLAKIASGLQKPNGLTTLSVADLPGRLEHLNLDDLCGISRGMLARLEHYGIRGVRDLWAISREQALRVWGSVSGAAWWAGFHGIDEQEPITHRRSMSHGSVLEPRFRTEEGARSILIRLLCKLGQRMRRNGFCARMLSIAVSDSRGGEFADKIPLPSASDTPTLLEMFHRLWKRRRPSGAPIRQVNVCVSGLIPASQVPRSLFGEIEKLERASHVADRINERLGALKIYFGPMHDYRHAMENKIAFGRIPERTD